MASGIYSITAPSGKRYIGSSINVARRWREHLRRLRLGTHRNPALQASFNKYGESQLTFALLELCDSSELIRREQVYIDACDWAGLYNLAPTAGNNLGVKHSAEFRVMRRELRLQQADPRLGKKHDAAAKAKMAAAKKGRAQTPEHIERARAARSGKKRADGTTGFYNVSRDCRNDKYYFRIVSNGVRKEGRGYDSPGLAFAMKLLFLEAWPYREHI